MLRIITTSVTETMEAGYKLGNILEPGDVICLFGDLGTGKTVFTGGIAKALGIDGYITSPTFSIVNEYNGRLPLFHFDVYRIADTEEMFEIGFEEYLDAGGIVVIEWAGVISDIIPENRIEVKIEKMGIDAGSIDKRRITFAFRGENGCKKKKELLNQFTEENEAEIINDNTCN